MRPRAILFLIGFLVFAMGAIPLAIEFMPQAADWKDTLPPAGSLIYQSVLILLGAIAIGHSLSRSGDKVVKKELMKALGR